MKASKKLEIDFEKEGTGVCPKCNGKGMKLYRYYEVFVIISVLGFLKTKGKMPAGVYPAGKFAILCPLCEGKGEIDWVSWCTRGQYKKRFEKYKGCLDIIYNYGWLMYKQKGQYTLKDDWRFRGGIAKTSIFNNKEFQNLEKLIESSQKRYIGPIMLDTSFLSMEGKELEEIRRKILNYYQIYGSKRFSEEMLNSYLINRGLTQFKPPEYAYPALEDFVG